MKCMANKEIIKNLWINLGGVIYSCPNKIEVSNLSVVLISIALKHAYCYSYFLSEFQWLTWS